MLTPTAAAHAPAQNRRLLQQLTDAFTPFRPAGPAPSDTLRLALVRSTRPGNTTAIALDAIASSKLPSFAAVAELQHRYTRQLRTQRTLASAGVPMPPPDENELLALGRAVAGLLPPAARAAIIAATQQARARGRHLRLVLEAQPDACAGLAIPWELLVLPITWGAPGALASDEFVLLNHDVSLVRRVAGLGRRAPNELARPLQLQAFAAAPAGGQPIDLAAAQAALSPVPASSWYAGPNTLGILHQRLHARQPQIVHLLCHGELCDTGRGSARCDLLLTHADGHTQRVPARDLARALAASPAVQLVLLQACHGGTLALGANATAESAALTLLRYGVPAVVAMQGEVGEQAAQVFAHTCYGTLAAGATIEQAVAAGRGAMRAAGGIADWSLPVLYRGSVPARANNWLFQLGARYVRN